MSTPHQPDLPTALAAELRALSEQAAHLASQVEQANGDLPAHAAARLLIDAALAQRKLTRSGDRLRTSKGKADG